MTEFKMGELSFSLPSSWNEVTLDQFLLLRASAKDADIIHELSILSSSDYNTLCYAEPSDDEWLKVLEHYNELIISIPNTFDFACPDGVTIEGKDIVIPKDLGLKTAIQKEIFYKQIFQPHAKAIFIPKERLSEDELKAAEENGTLEIYNTLDGEPMYGIFDRYVLGHDAVDRALAIYLQPLITGEKFNAYPEKMEPVIKKMRSLLIPEAFGIANFFFNGLLSSYSRKRKSITQPSQTKSEEQELKGSQHSES